MAITQKNVIVNDTDYMLTTIPARKSLKISKQLVKLLGPAFLKLQSSGVNPDAQGKKALDSNKEKEEAAMVAAVEALIDKIDDVDVEALIIELVTSGATKGTMAINFDIEFAGCLGSLFMLVKEIIVFNYQDVFSVLASNTQG